MRLVLIRHAHSESNATGVLSGRIPNVHLSAKGVKQSEQLSQRLGSFPVAQMRISPMERCFETVAQCINEYVLATNPRFEPAIDPMLNEVD